MLNCPKCGSPRVHRSRTRTVWERFRKNFTQARLHRCHACGWRGWGAVISAPPTVDAIDVAASETQSRPDNKPS